MKKTFTINVPVGRRDNPCRVEVRDGRITAVASETSVRTDYCLTAGLIDLHTHGIESYSYERPAELIAGTACLPRYGVTGVLPTIIPDPGNPQLLDHLRALADALDQVTAVQVPGLHLEGPFVALGGAACKTVPGDTGLLREMIAACRGRVAALSISPDVAGIIPVIEMCRASSIVPFITHTRASVDETVRAIEAGARHATHFYDVFHLPGPADSGVRPVGCVETILADARCTADFIADGVHVHPMAIKATLAAKGPTGIILITDSNIGAGLPAGVYDTPWGYPVRVAPGRGARAEAPGTPKHGVLAGSALTMDEGINNLMQWLDLPEEQIWAMGSANPAQCLAWPNKGVVAPGCDADLVLWQRSDDRYQVACTWVGGELVYRHEEVQLDALVD